MSSTYYVGRRVSFDSSICTIRYIGPVEGTDKQWLGVEWDNPKRGKHNGVHKSKRYFSCLSQSPTAASFVPIKKAADAELSFVEAVQQKYATDDVSAPATSDLDQPIEISGKVVENVGFEKIKQQQAQLERLEIVLVDGFRIKVAETGRFVRDTCPNIIELDLSRNLFESFEEIVKICNELKRLRSLRLNGNRLKLSPEKDVEASMSYAGVKELELDETLMPWENVCRLLPQFKSLEKLSASLNSFKTLSFPLQAANLQSLTLEYDEFTSLSDLSPLIGLPALGSLLLKGNLVQKIGSPQPLFGPNLYYIDLSYNKIDDWGFVDQLAEVFPGMTALRLSNNPLYDILAKDTGSTSSADDGFMLTLARVGKLKTLNFSNISDQERTNAEMFYLSRIGLEMAQAPPDKEYEVTARHKRYSGLCEMHGAPTVVRKSADAINPDFLEARLIEFTLYLPPNNTVGQEEPVFKVQEIPKGFDIYRVKGIVGRLYQLRPLSLKLIWETGEFDPVAGYEEAEGDSDEEDTEGDVNRIVKTVSSEEDKWTKREVELEDGTRQVGNIIDGLEARVRVELKDVGSSCSSSSGLNN